MARHSSGGLLAKLLGVGCGFVYAVGAARLLGPSGYGVVAVALSTATVVATFAVLGISGFAVRETASLTARQSWSELAQFVRWSSVVVAASSVGAALLMAASALIRGPYGEALMLGALAVPLFAELNLVRGILQGSGAVIVAQLPLEVGRWILTLLLIGLLFFRNNPVGPAAVMLTVVAGLVAALAAAASYARRILPRVSVPRRSKRRGRRWIGESLPFLAIALVGIIGTEISTLLLGWVVSPREAGLYQPIAKLAPLMMLANEAIEGALAPRIVGMWEAGEFGALQRLVGRSAVASAVGTAAIAGGIVVAAPLILRAFGPEFTRYQDLLIWVALAQIINAGTGAAPLLLAMSGDMKRRFQAQAATLFVQAGLATLLIPSFGAIGAVISLTAAIFTWSVLHWWLALRTTGIDTSIRGAFHRRTGAAI